MPKLPRPTGVELIRFLRSQGFGIIRVRGSHHVMPRGTVHTVVPAHGAQTLRIGTLRGILRDIENAPGRVYRTLEVKLRGGAELERCNASY